MTNVGSQGAKSPALTDLVGPLMRLRCSASRVAVGPAVTDSGAVAHAA